MFIVLDECNHGHGVLRNVTPTVGWGVLYVFIYIIEQIYFNWVFVYSYCFISVTMKIEMCCVREDQGCDS